MAYVNPPLSARRLRHSSWIAATDRLSKCRQSPSTAEPRISIHSAPQCNLKLSFAALALIVLPPQVNAANARPSGVETPHTAIASELNIGRRPRRRLGRVPICTAVSLVPVTDSPAIESPTEDSSTASALTITTTASATSATTESPTPTPPTTTSLATPADADVIEKESPFSALIPRQGDSKQRVAAKCFLLLSIFTAFVSSATIAVFWVIQDSLVYKPTSVWRGTPKAFGMPDYDDVAYKTKDGETIRGWFIRRPGRDYLSARTIIYFHGTDKNASFRLKKVAGLYEKCAANVLLVSYRGYGLSTGHPNEAGLRADAEGALHYLVARGDIDVTPGGSKLWVYGESLGGAVALYFTTTFQTRVNALVLENTFTSLLDMITRTFPLLGPARYLSRNRWLSRRRISRIRVPILFLSGLADAYIPPAMMKTMHRAAAAARWKRFVPFPGGTHNRTWTLPGFYEAVDDFMHAVDVEQSGASNTGAPLRARVTDAS